MASNPYFSFIPIRLQIFGRWRTVKKTKLKKLDPEQDVRVVSVHIVFWMHGVTY